MCELLGMSFKVPVSPNISFRGFRHRGEKNPDGWGLAFYPDRSAQTIKEPIKAAKSSLSDFLKNYQVVKSRIFIGHVRHASKGSASHENTHPFYRELNGKEYTFAHNGTLEGYEKLKLGRFKPIGRTDSEHAFCHLMNCIEKRNIINWGEEDFKWIHSKFKEINTLGKFNCIFSDGDYLFCYHDEEGHNGLCFIYRKPPYNKIKLMDEDWEVDLAEKKKPEEIGFIIATKRLTNEPWKSFQFGELIVFKDGKAVYSNYREITEISTLLTELEINILRILRNSPHRVSLKIIIEKLDYPFVKVKSSINSLICKEYIRQDSRDNVEWNDCNATFYTNPQKREEIDKLIV